MGELKAKVLLAGFEDEENLSIRYLAAALGQGGHEVRIAPCSSRSQIKRGLIEIEKFKPELIGISIAFQSLSDIFFDLVSRTRSQGYRGHITVGGHFPTFEFKRILETQLGIDSVVRFEGEEAILKLANSVAAKGDLYSVNNLVFRAVDGIHENPCVNSFQNLDELPFPRRDKPMERLGEKFATLVSSRGCWHSSCLYCCIGAFHSQKREKFALRSPENIAREIGELYHNRRVRLFQFHDDNFMLSSKKETVDRMLALKKAIESENIDTKSLAFLIKARPDTIDYEVASALKELGVVGVFLGIENASETGLKSLVRGVKLESIYVALESLEKFGIIPTFNLLIFHPRATMDEIDANIIFLKSNLNIPFDFGRAEVVAGSPLERMLISENKLTGSWPKWNYSIDDERVEKMFKINLTSFRGKDSLYSDMMQSTIALGYDAYLLKKLHPGPITDKLFSRARNLISEVNVFILDNIVKIRSMVDEPVSELNTSDFSKQLNLACEKQIGEIRDLEGRMMRLQISERAFTVFGIGSMVQELPILNSVFRLS
jgi:anaerobic magnesium-protoporphyrin IX monomethyl ester cyclase